MIGQSIINIKSGGRGRLSGIVAALPYCASYFCIDLYRNGANCCTSRCYVYGRYWNFCME